MIVCREEGKGQGDKEKRSDAPNISPSKGEQHDRGNVEGRTARGEKYLRGKTKTSFLNRRRRQGKPKNESNLYCMDMRHEPWQGGETRKKRVRSYNWAEGLRSGSKTSIPTSKKLPRKGAKYGGGRDNSSERERQQL